MIVHTETPEEYRKRLAKRTKRKARKAVKTANRREAAAAVLRKPPGNRSIPRHKHDPIRPGDDWWNNLKGDAPC